MVGRITTVVDFTTLDPVEAEPKADFDLKVILGYFSMSHFK